MRNRRLWWNRSDVLYLSVNKHYPFTLMLSQPIYLKHTNYVDSLYMVMWTKEKRTKRDQPSRRG